jgi:hypothetical protein
MAERHLPLRSGCFARRLRNKISNQFQLITYIQANLTQLSSKKLCAGLRMNVRQDRLHHGHQPPIGGGETCRHRFHCRTIPSHATCVRWVVELCRVLDSPHVPPTRCHRSGSRTGADNQWLRRHFVIRPPATKFRFTRPASR